MADNLPQHIAIVMDGNGRWATQRNRPRIVGHRAGAKVVRKIVEHAAKMQISVLSLFAFSLENKGRPAEEVSFLMSLMSESLLRNIKSLHQNNIKLRVVGDRNHFSEKLLKQVTEAETLTEMNTGLVLVMAIHYSGRWDITQATQAVASKVQQGELTTDKITIDTINQYISIGDLPEPDLLIRTSGEQRLSNFMLWQFAYTELYFCSLFWPDFTEEAFDTALDFYAKRERRFGLTSKQVEA